MPDLELWIILVWRDCQKIDSCRDQYLFSVHVFQFNTPCIHLQHRGALNTRAEIIPNEPDAGNAAEGR